MNSILIRAEDKNIWERRAPLVPADLKDILIQTKAKAFVQRCSKRTFAEEQYTNVGGNICNDLNPGNVILGIKEIPVEKIEEKKVYLFFSHTIKGQKSNMPMLQKIMAGGSTLIDYERIADNSGKRLVYFGNYAGHAGAIDIFWLMGEYWQHLGIETPFLKIKQALHYDSLQTAKKALHEVNAAIQKNGIPPEISPLTIGVLGYGNVAKGVQEILECLPIKIIKPEDLEKVSKIKPLHSNFMNVVIFKEEHLVKTKSTGSFNLADYYEHPENYESQFEKYLPYLSIILNAIYWDKRYPKFVTWANLKKLWSETQSPKLAGISDITCDVNGSIECNVKTTNPGAPAFLCNPLQNEITDGHRGNGIVILAVDNLPAELPYDASNFFSSQLKHFVPNLISTDFTKPLAESGLSTTLQKATIVHRGELMPDYSYLIDYL